MQEWIVVVGSAAALVGGIVHTFPNTLTRLVNMNLFRVWKITVTPQRVVGLITSIVMAWLLWARL